MKIKTKFTRHDSFIIVYKHFLFSFYYNKSKVVSTHFTKVSFYFEDKVIYEKDVKYIRLKSLQ